VIIATAAAAKLEKRPHMEAPEFVTLRIMDWLTARDHPALVYPRPK